MRGRSCAFTCVRVYLCTCIRVYLCTCVRVYPRTCVRVANEVGTDRERSNADEGEERGQDKVVRNRRHDAEQFHRRADQHVAVIIIVDVTAREPRVIRREGGGFQHRVEIRKIHRTLAALGRMPQVGVAEADEQIEQEQRQEYSLDDEERAPVRLPLPRQRLSLDPGLPRANQQDRPANDSDIRAAIGDSQRPHQPREVGQDDEAERARERVALVRESGQGAPRQRISEQSEHEDERVPDDRAERGNLVLQPVIIEQLRPRPARLLTRETVGRKHETLRRLVTVHFVREKADSLRQVHCAQRSGDFSRFIFGRLLEDQHLRMVVEGEGLLRRAVIDGQRPKRGIGGEGLHQFESQPPLEHARLGDAVTPKNISVGRTTDQLAVVDRRQRVTLGDAWDLRVLVIGGDENVIRLVEDILKVRQFIGVVVPVDLQVEVAVHPAEGVVAVKAEGQGPVVVRFVGDGRARQGHRARGLDAQEISLAFHQQERLVERECEGLPARVTRRTEIGRDGGGGQRGSSIRLIEQRQAEGLGRSGIGENVREQDFCQQAVRLGGKGRQVGRPGDDACPNGKRQGLGGSIRIMQGDRPRHVLVDPARGRHARLGAGVDAEKGEGPEGGEGEGERAEDGNDVAG